MAINRAISRQSLFLFLLFLVTQLFLGCEKIGNDQKKKIDYDARRKEIRQMIDTDGLSTSNFPFIDCSTSTSPLRDIVMYNILGMKYHWGIDVVSGSNYCIYWDMPKGIVQGSSQHKRLSSELIKLTRSSGSHGAYVNLIDGNTDLIIDSRDISRNELEYSKEKEVQILSKPLAWDAMVFLVHQNNKVKSLTPEQIQGIYTGDITNWKEVGGEDLEIHPYMRDPDSGSQEKMETMVMKGKKMIDWPEMTGHNMWSPYLQIMIDPKGIGYSPYFFCESMMKDLKSVKVIAVDNVLPSQEGILRSVQGVPGGYPFYSQIYAAIREDEPLATISHQIYDWFESESARSIVDESGYIPLE